MSKKKGAASSRNGRDSNAQRLGVKRFSGETVSRGHDHHAPARHQVAPRLQRREGRRRHAVREGRRRREVRHAPRPQARRHRSRRDHRRLDAAQRRRVSSRELSSWCAPARMRGLRAASSDVHDDERLRRTGDRDVEQPQAGPVGGDERGSARPRPRGRTRGPWRRVGVEHRDRRVERVGGVRDRAEIASAAVERRRAVRAGAITATVPVRSRTRAHDVDRLVRRGVGRRRDEARATRRCCAPTATARPSAPRPASSRAATSMTSAGVR